MDFPGKAHLLALFRERKALLFRFVATTLGMSALSMAAVLLIREFLSGVLDSGGGLAGYVAESFGPAAALWVLAALLVSTYVATSLLTFDNQVTQQRIVKILELGMMERLIRHLLTLSVPFFDRLSPGDVIQAVRQDVTNLRNVVLAMARLFLSFFTVLGLFAAAVMLSPRLTLWSLVVLPLAVVPIAITARRIYARSFDVRRTGYVLYDVILQLLHGIRVIKAYGGEEVEARAAVDKGRSYFDQLIEMVRVRALARVYLSSLSGLGLVVVIVVGGFDVLRGELSWPSLLAFMMALKAIHGPLNTMNASYVIVKNHGASVQRLAEFLDTCPEVVDRPNAQRLLTPPGHVALENVSFAYAGTEVLHDVSFQAAAGETIGIVGPSGAGKTTLLNLIARFYDATSGVVTLDGGDIRAFKLADVYSQVAIVAQNPFLFSSTVKANIAFGTADASQADVEAAAIAAGVHEEILAMPDGYETVLGTGGHGLSGGQAQRINIARALFKDAPLLLLDEATSSLDSLSEARVQDAIGTLMEGRTTFVVAHRLSTLRNADRIVVLDAGEVVGVGPHAELLETCDLYRRLWVAQHGGAPTPSRATQPAGLTWTEIAAEAV